MAKAAVGAAGAVGYTGVGTFEFLVDEDERFYFMEVNARIQVEHPVTEAITGVDLVREQLLVAAGYPLSLAQDAVLPHGVAVECRVNSEDPDRDFAPPAGVLETFDLPGGPFTRVDTHAATGYVIGPHYDSLHRQGHRVGTRPRAGAQPDGPRAGRVRGRRPGRPDHDPVPAASHRRPRVPKGDPQHRAGGPRPGDGHRGSK